MSLCFMCKLPLSSHFGGICPIGTPSAVTCDSCGHPWKEHTFTKDKIVCPNLCPSCAKYFIGEKCACNTGAEIVTKHFDNLFKELTSCPEFTKKLPRSTIHEELDKKINVFLNGLKTEYEKDELNKKIVTYLENNVASINDIITWLKSQKHWEHGKEFLIKEIERRLNAS